jgi:Zn-dependent protease
MKPFRTATFFGVPVFVTPGGLLLFAGIAALLATKVYPDVFEQGSIATHVAMAIVSALLFFLTIALHELGHCIVARAFHSQVKSVTINFIGGVSQISRESKTPVEELLVAGIGPVTNLAIAAALLGAWGLMGTPTDSAGGIVMVWLGSMNAAIAVLNFVPAFPLDGGRIFRSFAWMATKNPSRATVATAWVTRGVGWAMMATGAAVLAGADLVVATSPSSGVWLVFIGFFLNNAAAQALFRDRLSTELDRYSAGQLMSNPPVVQTSASVGSLARGVIEINPRVCYFVEDEGRLAGIISSYQMREVPLAQWDTTSAGDAMIPRAKLQPTTADRGLAQVLLDMENADITHMPVVTDGQVVGVIGRDRILGVLQKAGLLGR